MGNPELQGIFGIVPTPLTREGSLDEDGLGHLVEHCAKSGLHAAVVLGSNGEFPYLTCEEKLRIIEVAGEAAKGRIPLVAGASAYGAREAAAYARAAANAGCAAVMAALPVYWQLGFDEVKKHFETLAREGELPVIFYYYPEVTGMVLAPDQIAEIAQIDGIHGAKINVMNRSFLKRVVSLTRTRLWAVFAGTSFLTRFILHNEGVGIICPLPLIAPKQCLGIYDKMQKGDLDGARELQDELLGALPIFTGIDFPPSVSGAYWKGMTMKPYTGPPDRPESPVAMVKEALRLMGHPMTSVVRMPCAALTDDQAKLVARTLEDLGWL